VKYLGFYDDTPIGSQNKKMVKNLKRNHSKMKILLLLKFLLAIVLNAFIIFLADTVNGIFGILAPITLIGSGIYLAMKWIKFQEIDTKYSDIIEKYK
jgi:hypothetical protein